MKVLLLATLAATTVLVALAAPAGSATGPATFVSFGRCCGKATAAYIANIDGSGERKVSKSWMAVWSPNGRKVFFGFEIVDLKTRKWTNLPISRIGLGVDWSPDGRRIAYAVQQKIYVIAADGQSKRRRITNGINDQYPRWSPNGKRISYRSLEPHPDPRFTGSVGQIFTIALDGSNRQPLTTLVGSNDQTHAADWSPDGTKVVFESLRDEWLGFYTGELYVMNVDGSDVRRLTFSPGWDGQPDWSPDGKHIAFTSWRDGGKEPDIYVMDADGSNQRRIAQDGRWPHWVPRGATTKIPPAPAP